MRILDLCCKAGGCSVGYNNAAKKLGIYVEIIGVDIEPQPNYPFTFIQADAVTYLKENAHLFDFIHASPPCQHYTKATAQFRNKGKEYTDIYEPIRKIMYESGKRGVIENVPGSPVRADVVLNGRMFNLKVIRRRHFELVNTFALTNTFINKKGSVTKGDFVIIYGKCAYKKSGTKNHPIKPDWAKKTIKETWGYAMGIDWMKTDSELANAIPPAYTEYIGGMLFS